MPAVSAVVVLLGFFVAMGFWFITANSPTFDEPMHYYAGNAYFERGDFAVSYHLPALSKEIAVLPAYVLSRLGVVAPTRFVDAPGVPSPDLELLYHSPLPVSVQLLLARSAMLSLGVLTVLVVGRWASRLWGTSAGLVAIGLAVTEPTFIAHSSVVTPDIALTCFFTCFFYLLWSYRVDGSWRTFMLAGVALGAAIGSKYPALIALPALAGGLAMDAPAGVWAVPWRRTPTRGSRWQAYGEAVVFGALLCVVATVALLAIYHGYGIRHWFAGLWYQASQGVKGHIGFLWGRYSDHGWWYYFPVAFALKTPLPTLAVLAASLLLPRLGAPLRRADALWLIVPPLLFLAVMMAGGVNIGVRYILPIYPFLFILGARLASARTGALLPLLLAAAIAWNAVGLFRLAPHFLASANVLAGGPNGVARALSDSNVDWGQALGELERYLDREGVSELYLSYFGTARPSDYGIRYQYIPGFGAEEPEHLLRPSNRVLLAISVTNLYGVYLARHDLYEWLRDETPIATIGHAIYVYDLTGDAESHCRLADAYGVYHDGIRQAFERARCVPSAVRP